MGAVGDGMGGRGSAAATRGMGVLGTSIPQFNAQSQLNLGSSADSVLKVKCHGYQIFAKILLQEFFF